MTTDGEKYRHHLHWLLKKRFDYPSPIIRIILSYLRVSPISTVLCPHGPMGMTLGCLSENAHWLVTVGDRNRLILSDFTFGRCAQHWPPAQHPFTACALARTHAFIATGDVRGFLTLWPTRADSNALPATTIHSHTGPVDTCVIFLHDTRVATVGKFGFDGEAKIWDIQPGRLICLHIFPHEFSIWGHITLAADNAWIIIANIYKESLRVYDSRTHQPIRTLTEQNFAPLMFFQSTAISSDSRYIAVSVDRGARVYVWDTTTWAVTTVSHPDTGLFLRCHVSAEYIVVSSIHRAVIWKLSTRSYLRTVTWARTSCFSALSERVLVIGCVQTSYHSQQPEVKVYSIDSGTEIVEPNSSNNSELRCQIV